MAAAKSFDAQVAARTRAADQILRSKDLLAVYEAGGGLRADLEALRELGLQAEALSQVRSSSKAEASAATLSTLQSFAALQREYTVVMAVLRAVRHDLALSGATPLLLAAVDRILVDETAVILRPAPVPPPDPAEPGEAPVAKRRAKASQSQEAIRAEISRDAAALILLKDAHTAMAKRKVPLKRLEALREAALALSQSQAERTSLRGRSEASTASLRDTVGRQSQVWRACYALLAAAATQDDRIRLLLTGTSRRKAPSSR